MIMENAIINLSQLSFNANDVPINYQWSGYCKNSTEFKKYNFLETSCEDSTVYICSCDNGVALGDYLSNYIFCQPYMHDMENVLSPGYDYWFFQAWERAEPYFDELDEWVHDVVNHLMNNGYINRITCADMEFFIISEIAKYETQVLPEQLVVDVERICETALIKHFNDYLTENAEELDEDAMLGDGGEWAAHVLSKVKESFTPD